VPGRTEREVARELENRMLENGAATSRSTRSWRRRALGDPAPPATDAVLRSGDFVKLDFGALVDGYHSDMTRTWFSASRRTGSGEIYELVAASQAAGRAALKPRRGRQGRLDSSPGRDRAGRRGRSSCTASATVLACGYTRPEPGEDR